jgi:DNA-binding transcriptional MerR regulator
MPPQLPPEKAFFRIGEVADLLGVEPHVVRFWQEQFPQVRPERSSTNRFVYSRSAVAKLLHIRALLYEQGYTIAGARKALTTSRAATREAPQDTPPPPQGDDRRVAELEAQLAQLQHEVHGLQARLEAARAAEVAAKSKLDGADARQRAEVTAALAECESLLQLLDHR